MQKKNHKALNPKAFNGFSAAAPALQVLKALHAISLIENLAPSLWPIKPEPALWKPATLTNSPKHDQHVRTYIHTYTVRIDTSFKTSC